MTHLHICYISDHPSIATTPPPIGPKPAEKKGTHN